MPIYEYECSKCSHYLEALQRIADKPLRECPECGKHSLKRLVSAPMFRLAGSGWYETDFKSDKESKRNLAKKEEAPVADSKSESKGESSSQAKQEPATEGKSRTMVTKPAAKPPARGKSKTAARKPPTSKARKR
jgi:putative FmdB family regulatory protein